MELARLELSAAASPNEPVARYELAAPVLETPGEAVCRLVQTRWLDGAPRERVTSVRGENEMQALCLAIRLMVTEIEVLVGKHGPLVDGEGALFDPRSLGVSAIKAKHIRQTGCVVALVGARGPSRPARPSI